MTETKAQAESRAEMKAEIKELKADAKEAQAEARADARGQRADSRKAVSSAHHTAFVEAIREIEAEVASQWGREQFNEGARAAAARLRARIGLAADEPLPEKAQEAP